MVLDAAHPAQGAMLASPLELRLPFRQLNETKDSRAKCFAGVLQALKDKFAPSAPAVASGLSEEARVAALAKLLDVPFAVTEAVQLLSSSVLICSMFRS